MHPEQKHMSLHNVQRTTGATMPEIEKDRRLCRNKESRTTCDNRRATCTSTPESQYTSLTGGTWCISLSNGWSITAQYFITTVEPASLVRVDSVVLLGG
eukprot:CAMPEP_0204166678 /NCGR_PEP_ID=MMETSP0361-20130328/39210_1 /ASSEMBLY_ACC=CAM_ASM_000343 /TAXON_ID=268821 /ORGANISM="Scrippsiella Hangoei, Strain SHTV-5" /LENGTH=98 /DNA_ID=CAMNT_0051123861 /DNA_START=60 /DNA_END=352 /DNA_ORIENTATION=+